MIATLMDLWNFIHPLFHELFTLFWFVARVLSIPQVIPFTIIGIAGMLVRVRSRRI